MKITKKLIDRKTTIIQVANNLTGKQGRYRVALPASMEQRASIFETDPNGILFRQMSGSNEWHDLGLTIENKAQFVEAVRDCY